MTQTFLIFIQSQVVSDQGRFVSENHMVLILDGSSEQGAHIGHK